MLDGYWISDSIQNYLVPIFECRIEEPFMYQSYRSGMRSFYVMTLNLDVSVTHILECSCDFLVKINHD